MQTSHSFRSVRLFVFGVLSLLIFIPSFFVQTAPAQGQKPKLPTDLNQTPIQKPMVKNMKIEG